MYLLLLTTCYSIISISYAHNCTWQWSLKVIDMIEYVNSYAVLETNIQFKPAFSLFKPFDYWFTFDMINLTPVF